MLIVLGKILSMVIHAVMDILDQCAKNVTLLVNIIIRHIQKRNNIAKYAHIIPEPIT